MADLIVGGYRKTTSGLKERDRLDYWRDALCREFVQLDCETVTPGTFIGELRGGVGISGLRFSEVIADPQYLVRSRRQITGSSEADILVSFQIEDRGMIRQNGREALLLPGTFAMYDSSEPYSMTFRERFHQLILQIPRETVTRHLDQPQQYTAIPISARSGLGAIASDFIFSLARQLPSIQEASDDLAESVLELLALAFVASLTPEQFGTRSIMHESLRLRILQHIDTNLCNPTLTNSKIAEANGISVRYLHKLFAGEKETVHALILRKRLQAARDLLSRPAYAAHSIEEIAYATGFSSAAHFSRSFKKYFGFNPSAIR